ncbi:MAG: hypothetical protein B6I30_08750 [Desulfobacteraceae bacterium 4572_187]|nr:MAG: hypothetical protein B6I30_08750 [Desulfobacteraceae bacterium 4572_187]
MAALPLIVGMLTGIYGGIAFMVEDPALFLSLGLSAFWLWIPRVITAVIAVHLFDLYYKIKIYIIPDAVFSD